MSELKKFRRFGGYLSYRQIMNNRKLMEESSRNLPSVTSNPKGFAIYFLTGKQYLYQTLFCIQSLTKHSTEKFKFILVDDGSFNDEILMQINTQLPGAEIITQLTIEKNLKDFLPQHNYSYLHNKRKIYPHIKKLTDIHTIPTAGWKLVLDSDMLFWDEPKEIIEWLKKCCRPIHMVDCTESYGYSRQLMEQLAEAPIPSLLNVGVIGLNSNDISWDKVENWIKILEEKEGKTYYLEQALSAMLIGNNTTVILNKDKYIVNPSKETIRDNVGILHHYVDLSKEGYYNIAWKKVI